LIFDNQVAIAHIHARQEKRESEVQSDRKRLVRHTHTHVDREGREDEKNQERIRETKIKKESESVRQYAHAKGACGNSVGPGYIPFENITRSRFNKLPNAG